MPKVNCRICSQEFYVKPSHLKIGYGKFCSMTCRSESQKKGKFVNCDTCGNQTWKAPKDLKHAKSGKFFCSKKCQTIWRNTYYIHNRHANWTGGMYSYKNHLSRQDGIEQVCKLCKNTDSRILAVHHLDKNRQNNEVSNLIWLCHNCHFLVHHYMRPFKQLEKVLEIKFNWVPKMVSAE